MNQQFLFICLATALFSCKENPKTQEASAKASSPPTITASHASYPEDFAQVLRAHGGIEAWKSKRGLQFDIVEPEGNETHTIDLRSRKDRIEMPGLVMGFDGKDVWIQEDGAEYTGDPVFYHNLMFYFFAMPFVLADEGIQYVAAKPLEYGGVSYPGIGIRYEAGVGTSPKDEYYLHYHPDTHRMAWLGYTVTYHSGERSDEVKWIRYPAWQEVSGLLLPEKLTWYHYEGRQLKEPRNTVTFSKVVLNSPAPDGSLFTRPEKARIVSSDPSP